MDVNLRAVLAEENVLIGISLSAVVRAERSQNISTAESPDR